MCGRFANHLGAMHGWGDILSDWPGQASLSFNIAPTQLAPIVTQQGCQIYRWGLLPSWLKQPKTDFSTFNARLPTLDDKPSFKHAWQSDYRCLIPALGYYEWREENGIKQAYFVCRKDGRPILFGGLFEPPRDNIPGSFTIITRPAEGPLTPLHHAMPLMFDDDRASIWFAGNKAEAQDVAWLAYEDAYQFYPVSERVNKVTNQGRDLIEQIDQSKGQQGFGF